MRPAFLAPVFLGLILGACAKPATVAAPKVEEPSIRSAEFNETAVPIQERFQLLGTAERELDNCRTTRLSPVAGGDRRPRQECLDPRYPLPAFR
jgi:hypothetical protein